MILQTLINPTRSRLLIVLCLTAAITQTSGAFSPRSEDELRLMSDLMTHQNSIDDTDLHASKSSEVAASFRSLVDPNGRYGDVWEAVGREARSK